MSELRPGEHRIPANRKGPLCASCSAFFADVGDVVTDQGPRPLCWTCRHAVIVHGVPVHLAWDCESVTDETGARVRTTWPTHSDAKLCMCTARLVYPRDVLDHRAAAYEIGAEQIRRAS